MKIFPSGRMFLILILVLVCSCSGSEPVELWFNADSPVLNYAADRFARQVEPAGFSVKKNRGVKNPSWDIVVLSGEDQDPYLIRREFSESIEKLSTEGFRILAGTDTLFIMGKTDRGCLYGLMEVIEQLGPDGDFKKITDLILNPAFAFRAIKFNLPYAPYRPGPATEVHEETCRDLDYWEAFLDMMVENRFNALTLWSTHLFPYMIRAKNFPYATPFNRRELQDWQQFWSDLFKMAKERGIETYLVNWNIVVSQEFADAYGAKVHDDRSDLVKQYTRESVTQLINEYPNLTGLGVTLADWMGNWGDSLMTPAERESWIRETFVQGMKDADHRVRFIHRAVLAGDPAEMRKVIDEADLPDKAIVEIKFNWSHGHSTPDLSLTHSNDEGSIMRGFWDPEPENYFIAWTVRNEDFFVLRWGDPDFIRKHIKTNHHAWVDGYFVGSEGYIPAKDYSYREHLHKSWDYAFQKQWLFYHLWGRLTFNPDETDSTLARTIENRYPETSALDLLRAYTLASRVPLQLASFYKSTWDFTLYSEGFLAPWTIGYDDGESPFISLEELIRHETLDKKYLSISDYNRFMEEGAIIENELITPPELANQLNFDCMRALELITLLRVHNTDPTLTSELDDLETWCHLGFYFAEKLRAGVAVEGYRHSGNVEFKEIAIEHLQHCIVHWENVIRLTAERYRPMPYVSMGHQEQKWPDFSEFHWKDFMKDVEADLSYVKSMEE